MVPQIEQELIYETISKNEVSRLIIETLDLGHEEIDPAAPLFGDGLGLDSIDLLEIALSISQRYGINLRAEDCAAFASVSALTTHVNRHRTK
jgi:acyl carrier protein